MAADLLSLHSRLQLFDLHRKQVVYTLSSHQDTISSLRLSPTGSHLLSLSFDSTLKVWDVRPFAISNGNGAGGSAGEDERLTGTLTGAAVGANDSLLVRADWSRDGKRIVSGSCDRTCVVWDMEDMRGKVLYKLPGHRGTCTAAALHPREPIGEFARQRGEAGREERLATNKLIPLHTPALLSRIMRGGRAAPLGRD